MPAQSLRLLRIVSTVLAVVSLILIGLGGYVRGTGAGLACPDWPLCYGRAVPDQLKPGVLQEVGHRYLASLVALLTVVFAVISFRCRREYAWPWRLSLGLSGILFVQIILGGLTVLMRLNPLIVTAHLAIGTIFFQAVALYSVDSFGSHNFWSARSWKIYFLGLAVLIYAQIVLGGFVGSSGSSLVCPDIPLCFGEVLPDDATPQQLIHMLHRLNGVLIAVLVFLAGTVYVLKRPEMESPSPRSKYLIAMTILVTVQVLLGFSSVYLRIPVALAVTHLVIAQLLLFFAVSLRR